MGIALAPNNKTAMKIIPPSIQEQENSAEITSMKTATEKQLNAQHADKDLMIQMEMEFAAIKTATIMTIPFIQKHQNYVETLLIKIAMDKQKHAKN